MKYVKQFGIILLISFAGEALNYLLPLPVPASIYGLVLMFLCLQLRVFRLEDVRDTALLLIEIIFFFNDPAATEICALSLRDALPISEESFTFAKAAPRS